MMGQQFNVQISGVVEVDDTDSETTITADEVQGDLQAAIDNFDFEVTVVDENDDVSAVPAGFTGDITVIVTEV
jgi:hypothetical protein